MPDRDYASEALARIPGTLEHQAARRGERKSGNGADYRQTGTARRLISRRASDIAPKDIDFIWEGRLARGKHTCIGGEPGTGKSTLVYAIIAAVTTGGLWPCGEGYAPLGNVIILSAEDDPDDTIVPRLKAAGADLDRVDIISAVTGKDGKSRTTFNLQNDLDLLEQKIDEIGDVVLVDIDPVSSYLGKTDSHKNSEVRGLLEPISEMAARKRVAVLSVTHFSKSNSATTTKALHRFIGSIAFVGAPRAAFAVIEDADNEGRMLFLHAKNNMAKPPQGLAFRMVQTLLDGLRRPVSYVAWDNEPVAMTANEALKADADSAEARSAQSEAEEFLEKLLSKGPVPAKDGEEHARALGIAPRTLKRARKVLGVIAEKDGLKEGWSWSLPAEGGQTPPEGGQINVGTLWASLAPFGSERPARPPRQDTPGRDVRAPALGPTGDSLDDFK
jgi:putative DNA primase/helicase